MKKIKFYLSFLKERDWLEEMARKGSSSFWITSGKWLVTGGIVGAILALIILC